MDEGRDLNGVSVCDASFDERVVCDAVYRGREDDVASGVALLIRVGDV